MSGELGPFPLDEVTLSNLEHALHGHYVIDEDGQHLLEGSEFTVAGLLDFLSGWDDAKLVDHGDGWSEYEGQVYHEHDVIQAMITEIRRLRALHPGPEDGTI